MLPSCELQICKLLVCVLLICVLLLCELLCVLLGLVCFNAAYICALLPYTASSADGADGAWHLHHYWVAWCLACCCRLACCTRRRRRKE